MQALIQALRTALPLAIEEMNSQRIPQLEAAWGRSFQEEMQNESQVTVEIAKNYARPLNNAIYRRVREQCPEFQENTINGSDYEFQGALIEDKNSFSEGVGWVGNGFDKAPLHLLKKFTVNSQGRITGVFAALVDLSQCQSGWSAKTTATNRSVIQFTVADLPQIQVIMGTVKTNKKYLKPQPEPIG